MDLGVKRADKEPINMFVRKAGICRWPVSSVDTDITSLNNWNFKPDNFIPEIQSSALAVSVMNH